MSQSPIAQASQTGNQQLDPRLQVPLSRDSSPGFPDGVYFASDFLLGAGMVILQPSTSKVVIVYDENSDYWFLPKGRKDVGESLEDAALREAYEEVRTVVGIHSPLDLFIFVCATVGLSGRISASSHPFECPRPARATVPDVPPQHGADLRLHPAMVPTS